MEQSKRFFDLLMEISEIMLANGSEVSRVEDTMNRMAKAYGAQSIHVFAINSSIYATIIFNDDNARTQTRRIYSSVTDFTKLEKANALSRNYCKGNMSVEQLAKEVKAINSDNLNPLFSYLGSALGAGGFALIFGGSLYDGLLTALIGVLVNLIQKLTGIICKNKIASTFINSFISATIVCLLCKQLNFISLDKVMIGTIMLLVPGLALTNSVKDILVGDTLTGIMRLFESLFWAASMTLGVIAAMWIAGFSL